MPDESDFKNYKTIEEFGKTVEGSRYYHDLYLKAVNHPIRRKILHVVNDAKRISKNALIKRLIEDDVIDDEKVFKYNIDFLIKALCINPSKDEKVLDIYYEITQAGKVVEYYEEKN